MSRRSFLIGHLTGLMLGIGLMFAVNYRASPPEPDLRPTIIPVSRVEEAENRPEFEFPRNWDRFELSPTVPQERHKVPPEWHSFEFNGQTVYVVPLSQNELAQSPQ